jgi:hypothetical protein
MHVALVQQLAADGLASAALKKDAQFYGISNKS